MGRPKGSKNKKTAVDLDTQIAKEQEQKAALEAEKAEIQKTIDDAKAKLKTKNKELRGVAKRLASLEAKKAEAVLAAASAAKRVEIQNTIAHLLDSGVDEDEILEKLNK